jgi:hypothetical protein
VNDEEYLRACGGWTCDYGHTYRTLDKEVHDPWSHEHHGSGLTIADAVAVQLAEDRARFAFVLARTPQPEPRSCDPGFFVEAPDALTVTTPEDARRLFGEPMYEPGGAPSNAAAAAIEALKTQRPVMAVKIR